MLRKTESAEVVRRRGRWLSVKTLEIYLQEVQVSTYLERVKPDAKVLIELRSGGFAPTLDRCIDFLQCGVPPNIWYYLFRDTAEFPEQRFGRMGVDGKQPASTSDAWQQKNFPKHSGKTRGRLSQYIYMYMIVYAHICSVERKHQVDARSFVDHLLNRSCRQQDYPNYLDCKVEVQFLFQERVIRLICQQEASKCVETFSDK